MLLRKISSPGLAHYSYLIADSGKAAVVDPRRDCQEYLDIASEQNLQITHIFETHRNEDYVTGSCELSQRTGAEVFHGAAMDFQFGNPVRDGDRFHLGRLEISVLETPGHTRESISLVVRQHSVSANPMIVFTGDALFAGEVGRTDFFGPDKSEWASGMLYESIHEKILPLGDGVIVCPAHGAGSVCGAEITDQEYTTIGFERINNPLLQLDKSAFVERKGKEHHYTPPYFSVMEKYNREGPPLLHHPPDLLPLSPGDVEAQARAGAQLVDIRSPGAFGSGHITNSLSIWRNGIPAFAGWVLSYNSPIILVDDFNLDLQAVSRHFMRLGYDNLKGYLAGGFSSWTTAGQKIQQLESWSVVSLHEAMEKERMILLDVRDINNRKKNGYIMGSRHVYAGELPGRLAEIPKNQQIVIYCDAGYKGCLAGSLLLRAGYERVVNILGGFSAWRSAGFPVEQ